MQNNTPGTVTKFFGHIISFVFHPLFIPTYFILYLIKVVPFEFVGITDWQLSAVMVIHRKVWLRLQ